MTIFAVLPIPNFLLLLSFLSPCVRYAAPFFISISLRLHDKNDKHSSGHTLFSLSLSASFFLFFSPCIFFFPSFSLEQKITL